MNKLQDWLEKYLLPVASKIQGNKFISAVSDGFSIILPIIMIGAIFTLVTSMQLGPYQNFITTVGIKPIFSFASKVTTDLLALYAVAAISFSLTKKNGYESDAIIVLLISLFSFLILIPLGVSGAAASGDIVSIAGAIPTGFLGAKGLFMAIIVGLIVPTIYLAILKKGLIIRLPDSVPPTIAKSFNALVPAFIIAILLSLVRFGFTLTSFGDANAFIYALIGKPLTALGSNPFSVIGFIMVCQLLWFFGLHGFMVILPFLQTIFLPLSLENLQAYESLSALPNQIVYQHFGTYVLIGGSGAVLGLAITMAFFAKSKQFKTLGRLSLPSVIFGINEPIIFGIPMVLNSIMLIPFMLTPILMFVIPYALQLLNLLPTLRGISLPLGTPVILYGWLQGGFPIVLMQIVLVFVQALVYFPFFKMLDNKALLTEKED